MTAPLIGYICIGLMILLIILRCPVALAMAFTGFVGFGSIIAFQPAIAILESGIYETLTNYSFSPIPMFIFMGALTAKAKISSDLFRGVRALFGGWRGGIALAAITSCGIFSSISGSSLATAATMGRIALPEMKANGYSPSFASGVVAAGGTLGIMIPPSIALLLYALITEQSVGDMFMAGIIPGLLGLALYCITITVVLAGNPRLALASPRTTLREKFEGLRGLIPFTLIFAIVIGGIYGGIFTPTEAGAIGAATTFIVGLFRGMRSEQIKEAIKETLMLSAMIFFMIIGAEIFGYFLSVSRIPQTLVEFIQENKLSPYTILYSILFLFLILGCIMDSMAMMLLMVPIVYPIILAAGFDPVWFGILVVITVELGLITPPVGLNVFVIKSVAKDVSITDIYKGVMPFIIADVIRLFLIILIPSIALALL